MRFIQLVFCLLICFNCFSQDSIPVRRVDTLLPFFGNRPLSLYGYENRSVPYADRLPLYVLITYPGGKSKSHEYFRIDSSTYLVYQFFRSDKGSSNKGLKSAGNVKIVENILDSANSTAINAGTGSRSVYKRYYKGFSREGEWKEYVDSLFFHQFWSGKYEKGKKVGIWSNYIYDPSDYRLLVQIDYDRDSTEKRFTINLAGILSPDSIRYFLNGRWTLACEDDKDRRMLMSKCQLYDGDYGDDCNSRFGDVNYYDFLENGVFKRQKGETCDKFKQPSTSGRWRVYRNKDDLFIEIKLATGFLIKYRVLYLDREGNMVADRQ